METIKLETEGLSLEKEATKTREEVFSYLRKEACMRSVYACNCWIYKGKKSLLFKRLVWDSGWCVYIGKELRWLRETHPNIHKHLTFNIIDTPSIMGWDINN